MTILTQLGSTLAKLEDDEVHTLVRTKTQTFLEEMIQEFDGMRASALLRVLDEVNKAAMEFYAEEAEIFNED